MGMNDQEFHLFMHFHKIEKNQHYLPTDVLSIASEDLFFKRGLSTVASYRVSERK